MRMYVRIICTYIRHGESCFRQTWAQTFSMMIDWLIDSQMTNHHWKEKDLRGISCLVAAAAAAAAAKAANQNRRCPEMLA